MSLEPSPVVFQPQILVLCCRQALAGESDLEGVIHSPLGFTARQILIPCTGKIEIHHLLKYLDQGVDGIEIVGCHDHECRFLDGSARLEKRIERTRHLLVLAGMNPDRIGLDYASGLTAEQLMTLVESRVTIIRPLGRNPMQREFAK